MTVDYVLLSSVAIDRNASRVTRERLIIAGRAILGKTTASGARVLLQRLFTSTKKSSVAAVKSKWKSISSTKTDKKGKFKFNIKYANKNIKYRFYFAGNNTYTKSYSKSFIVKAKKKK